MSLVGLILLSVFINDLLLFIKKTDICNFAYDTILYDCGRDLGTISNKLELDANTAIQ